ncbi:MAG: VWA domain-containing protein [Hyphomicrobiaceae bacterium]
MSPKFLLLRTVSLAAAAVFAAILPNPTRAADSVPVDIKAELAQGILPAGAAKRTFIRIAVTPARRSHTRRAPMNVALVIDRSGSMASHARMTNAREAARMAVDRLGRDDILSVVSYDNRVDVDVPATKVIDPAGVKRSIDRLTPRGSTAIHAALLAASNEVRKFKSRDRVNRIVLISDGLANVGPSKPADFEALGRELASEGITVSTIGLGTGYNEDLMAGLARAADGGHVFVQESADLAGFLAREFDDAQSIVGQEVEIIIRLKDGVHPLRSLGREAKISADKREIAYKVGALVGGVEQVLLGEIEIDAASTELKTATIAEISVAYTDVATGRRKTESATASVSFDRDHDRAGKSINAAVMRDVTTLVSRATRQEAVRLRDKGRLDEARSKFEANAKYVREQQKRLPGAADYAPLVEELKANELAASKSAQTREGWQRARKVQRATDGNKFGASQKY